jgi:hypothetical protein
LKNNNNFAIINDSDKPTHCTKLNDKIVKYNIIDLILVSYSIKNKISEYDTTSHLIYDNLIFDEKTTNKRRFEME